MPANPLPPADPAELSKFSLLANGVACFFKAEASMAPEILGAPSAEIVAAWAFLTSPRGAILGGLLQGGIDGTRHNFSILASPTPEGEDLGDDDDAALIPRSAAGYPDEILPTLAAAVRAATADIAAIAASPQFFAAARKMAPMVSSPSSADRLAYPLLGLGIKSGIAKIGGQRRSVIAGASLDIASAHDAPAQLQGLPSEAASEVREALQAMAAIDALPKNTVNLPERPVSYGAMGRAAISGDARLPSCQLMREAISKSRAAESSMGELSAVFYANRETFANRVERAAEQAVLSLRSCALDALSAGMVRLGAGADALSQRSAKLSISSGPHAQASEAAAIFEPHLSLAAIVRAPESLCCAMMSVAKGLVPGFADNPAAVLSLSNTLSGSNPLAANFFEPWATAEFQEKAFELAFSSGSRSPTHFEKRYRSEFSSIAGRRHNHHSASWQVLAPFEPPTFPAGSGFEGLCSTLAQGDARLGVSQWAYSAFRALDWGSTSSSIYDCSELFSRSGYSAARHVADPRSGELAQALIGFAAAIKAASIDFASAAVAAAQISEDFWMESAGLLPAWIQASAVEAPTSASVRWALANPQGESIASSDPMARLAGAAARGFGLRAGTAAQAKEQLQSELAERGLDANGFALLSESEDLRSFIGKLAVGSSGQGRKAAEARFFSLALPVVCKSISSAARVGMLPAEASLFVKALCDVDSRVFQSACADAFGDDIGHAYIQNPSAAERLAEAARFKTAFLPTLFDLFAKDWSDARAADALFAVPDASSIIRLSLRFSAAVETLPISSSIDWTSDPFSGRSLSEVFGLSSPRLQAVRFAAAEQGGLAGWCSELSVKLDIVDAADPNDLIGKCKARIKLGAGMSEAAWKSAIKSDEALALIGQQWPSEAQIIYGSEEREPSFAKHLCTQDFDLDQCCDQNDFAASRRTGACVSFACANGVSPAAAWAAIPIFSTGLLDALLSPSIEPRTISTLHAAEFFAAEASAKERLMPIIFKEACKRLERLAQDRQESMLRGDAENPLPAAEALGEEASSMCDWIEGSEPGVWQNIPANPTWGQLSRLSAAWHAEALVKAADQAARDQIKAAAEISPLAPFAPRSSAAWEPIVGAISRDGWSAHELLTQADLSEEGAAMGHCVSGYSAVCRNGKKRIFSVRLNGERRCTLELSSSSSEPLHKLGEDAGLKITQNKGRYNASVTNSATIAFCSEVAAGANAAWSKKWAQTQEAILLDKAAKAAARKASRKGIAAA